MVPDETPQNAASHLGLFCLLTKISSKNKNENNTPDVPENESGHIKMIRMENSIRHKWVNIHETSILSLSFQTRNHRH